MASTLNRFLESSWNPLRLHGHNMSPPLLLMCKLLFIVLLQKGYAFYYIREPFVPFLLVFDQVSEFNIFKPLLTTTFFVAGTALLFNRFVRTSAFLLGLVIFLAQLASQVYFRNHVFICACLYLLASFHRKDDEPWLIRYQLVIIYFGAYINKQLDIDWLTGRYFENWAYVRIEHPQYIWLASFFPQGWLSLFCSWATIAGELTAAICFAFKRTFKFGFWVSLMFHFGTFIYAKGWTFGFFVEAISLTYLAFLLWPQNSIQVKLSPDWKYSEQFKRVLHLLDWGKKLDVEFDKKTHHTIHVIHPDGCIYHGYTAIKSALFYALGFYAVTGTFLFLCNNYIPYPFSFVITAALIALSIAILFPWEFFLNRFFQKSQT